MRATTSAIVDVFGIVVSPAVCSIDFRPAALAHPDQVRDPIVQRTSY
jgi:hypothetical protein